MTTPTVMVIAHRGASSYGPENTLAAFDLALQMEVRHIELDVDVTSDGHIVVIHDDTVDRTTNGSGAVTRHTLAALRALDAGSWFGTQFAGERIPTFDEVLARYKGRAHIHTEIKGTSLALAADSRCDTHAWHGGTGHHDLLPKSALGGDACLCSRIAHGVAAREVSDATIVQAHAMGLTQLCPPAQAVTPALVRRLHAEGFVARAWGVTTEELMQQVVQAGADGMTINFPDKLIAYLKSHNSLWE